MKRALDVFAQPFGRSERLAVARTRCEAVAAVNGFVAARLERHFGHAAALTAGRFEHLAMSAAATLRASRLASRTAVAAPVGLIGKALHGVKFLLARRERELASAINAGEHFGGVHR